MTLFELRNCEKEIYIYCAGVAGQAVYGLLKKAGISITAFIDNDIEKNQTTIVDDLLCFLPDNIQDKETCIVIIGISKTYYKEVFQTVKSQGFSRIHDVNDLIDDIILNERNLYLEYISYYGEIPFAELFFVDCKIPQITNKRFVTNKRIAVYTSVFGDYDPIRDPECVCDNVDYYYIADYQYENVKVYKWIDASSIVPDYLDNPIKRNRYVKMHPHLIFPEYDYSIYVDGNINLIGDVNCFVLDSKTGISVFHHPHRDCLFYEALAVSNFKRVNTDDVIQHMERYLSEGMPIHFGLPEMSVIGRAHNRDICIKIMEEWWNEFQIGAQRDQLSFMYVVWKNACSLKDVALIGSDFRKSSVLTVSKHKEDSHKIKNESI